MKPSAFVAFAGDAGRASEGAGRRAAAWPWRSAGSVEKADAAGHDAAISTNGTIPRDDLFMRTSRRPQVPALTIALRVESGERRHAAADGGQDQRLP